MLLMSIISDLTIHQAELDSLCHSFSFAADSINGQMSRRAFDSRVNYLNNQVTISADRILLCSLQEMNKCMYSCQEMHVPFLVCQPSWWNIFPLLLLLVQVFVRDGEDH